MYLSEDYLVFEIHQKGEERLRRELELRRVIGERAAEAAAARAAELAAARAADPADPAEGVTDAARPRRGIRALLPGRFARGFRAAPGAAPRTAS